MVVASFDDVQDFADALVSLFSEFTSETQLDEPQSHHDILMSFSPISARLLESADAKTLASFCDLVNRMVAAGGVAENAISTCFLEHASQIGVRKIIQLHLSAAAKAELG